MKLEDCPRRLNHWSCLCSGGLAQSLGLSEEGSKSSSKHGCCTLGIRCIHLHLQYHYNDHLLDMTLSPNPLIPQARPFAEGHPRKAKHYRDALGLLRRFHQKQKSSGEVFSDWTDEQCFVLSDTDRTRYRSSRLRAIVAKGVSRSFGNCCGQVRNTWMVRLVCSDSRVPNVETYLQIWPWVVCRTGAWGGSEFCSCRSSPPGVTSFIDLPVLVSLSFLDCDVGLS